LIVKHETKLIAFPNYLSINC